MVDQEGGAERVIFVCARVRDASSGDMVRGSVQRECMQCAEPVWLSPASVGYMKQGDACICTPCVRKMPSDLEIDCLPETVREVSEALGRPVGREELLDLGKELLRTD